MSLFTHNAAINLLPADGEVYYLGVVVPPAEANRFLQILMHSVAWKNDEAVMFGKHIVTKRKVAWYGDAAYAYTYSNITKTALPWTAELHYLKQLAQQLTGATYNSCLLNLYHSGDEGMAWHSDDEKTLAPGAAIASMSFGAERRFSFKHKQTADTRSLVLEHGSLLVMKGQTQQHWLHRLPPTKKVTGARINLTFRTIV